MENRLGFLTTWAHTLMVYVTLETLIQSDSVIVRNSLGFIIDMYFFFYLSSRKRVVSQDLLFLDVWSKRFLSFSWRFCSFKYYIIRIQKNHTQIPYEKNIQKTQAKESELEKKWEMLKNFIRQMSTTITRCRHLCRKMRYP